MDAAEKIEPAISEPLSWDEICKRYPDQFVCLTEVDYVDPASRKVLTARVIGGWRARGEAIEQAELWRARDHRISVRLTGKYDSTHLRPGTIIDDEIRQFVRS